MRTPIVTFHPETDVAGDLHDFPEKEHERYGVQIRAVKSQPELEGQPGIDRC
jgi:hypothetical protein